MITKEEYDEIIDRKIQWEDISCSCHVNPPCSKCTDSPGDEELESVKEYEEQQKKDNRRWDDVAIDEGRIGS